MNTVFISIVSKDFLEPFTVMVKSLLTNNNNFCYDYIILYTSDITQETLERNEGIILLNTFTNILYKPIDNSLYQKYSAIIKNERFNTDVYNAFYRFEIFNFDIYDRLIYLDCDLVINDNLDYLIDICIKHELYAVEHDKYGIFNAGVMVINKKTTFADYKKRCIQILDEYLELNKKTKGNQEILNTCFIDKCFIDKKYNLTVEHASIGDISRNNFSILHYPGEGKPWLSEQFSAHYQRFDQEIRDTFVRIWRKYKNIKIS